MLAKLVENFSARQVETPWLVGVSGGADSLCLLDMLHRRGIPVIAAHFNHQLRPQAASDAERTAETASRLGVPFILGSGDVRAAAQLRGQSLEAAARLMRYAFLFNQARQCNAGAVAVAHTADDQVETILLHILRGAGPAGLQGMPERWLPNPWSTVIPLVRPLLGVTKQETVAYCHEHGLQPVLDETNLDSTYTRNRLRLDLLPALETFNPALRSAILRLAEVARGEQEILEPLVEEIWRRRILTDTGFLHQRLGLNLDVSNMAEVPIGMRRLLARRTLVELRPGLADIDFETVERLAGWMANSAWRGPADLPGGLSAWRRKNTLTLVDRNLQYAASQDIPVSQISARPPSVSGDTKMILDSPDLTTRIICLSGDWRLSYRLLEDSQEAQAALHNRDPFQAWLDMDNIKSPLTLRSRWPGARFQPLGMAGKSKKLSDVMIDAHLPRLARKTWPLLCAGDQVLWIPGLAAGDAARITLETKRVIWLRLWQERTVSDRSDLNLSD